MQNEKLPFQKYPKSFIPFQTMRKQSKNILIINQHGENRGDEAAMRAMLAGLENNTHETRFTIIAQFRDVSLNLAFKENVKLLHMKMAPHHFLGLVFHAFLKAFSLDLPFLLDNGCKAIIEAYQSADIVISAPGGPYFGDIYSGHELVHWFYVWLAKLHGKALFLYAPSAGPFNIKLLNPIRRHLYRQFDTLTVREELSGHYMKELLGEKDVIHVTADSALQQSFEPYSRNEYFTDGRRRLMKKRLIAVSAIHYKFPGDGDAGRLQCCYVKALLHCLKHLQHRADCHFLFFPQLYGSFHSDVSFLEGLAEKLPPEASWEIVAPDLDSDTQRRLMGMCDLCLASRYHPQIFAASAAVPGICIYYEHKALGFMTALGLRDFAFDIRKLDADAMCVRLDEALERHDDISSLIGQRMPALKARARETTALALQLLERSKPKR